MLFVLVIGAAAFFYMRQSRVGGDESPERLAQKITIKDAQTGDEWTIMRGKMISQLRGASANGVLDPKNGLINPKTKKPSGFPVDRGEWDPLIERLNQERAAYNKSRGANQAGS